MADQAYLEILDIDDPVKPEDAMSVKVKVWNDYMVVGPGDDNRCVTWEIPSGLKTYLEVENVTTGETIVQTEDFCMETGGQKAHRVTFRAPESEGEHQINVRAYFAGTEEIFGAKFRKIQVDRDAPETNSCLDDGDCGEGQECVDGTCKEESDNGNGAFDMGKWVIQHPVESAVGMVGFAIVVNQALGD